MIKTATAERYYGKKRFFLKRAPSKNTFSHSLRQKYIFKLAPIENIFSKLLSRNALSKTIFSKTAPPKNTF